MRIPGPLLEGRFISRPNRFLAVVELEGREVEAHLPDPGRLEELLLPDTRVWMRPAASEGRKTRFTLALVEAPTRELVSVVTTLPNELVAEALHDRLIGELAEWDIAAREHRWGGSRFDFLLKRGEGRLLLEVKSVTLLDERGGRALFPDAVTVRGARHLRELAEALTAGFESAVLFVVQRSHAMSVAAARSIDPNFAAALEAAQAAGVLLLAYRSRVSLSEAVITEPIPVRIA